MSRYCEKERFFGKGWETGAIFLRQGQEYQQSGITRWCRNVKVPVINNYSGYG